MVTEMNRLVERTKSSTDNSISQKDMLWYVVGRVDEVHEKVSKLTEKVGKQVEKCQDRFATKKLLYFLISSAIAVMSIVIVIAFNR